MSYSQSNKRSRQIADLIHQEIAILLKREISDPRLQEVSITSVRLSPDKVYADIYFTLHDVSHLAAVKQAFTKASPYLRRMLADRVELRYLPRLNFIFDQALEEGAKMTDLIEKARQEDERLKSLRHDDDE